MDAVGFGKASLRGAWKTVWTFADDIEANAVVFRPEHGSPVALVTCDLAWLWPQHCLELRDAVAERLCCAPDQVCILSTQNHGAPGDAPGVFDAARMKEAFVQAADQALKDAVPATMNYVEVSPDPPGVVNRRLRVGELGSFTFYYGFELRPDGRAGGGRLLDLAARGLLHGPERTPRCPCPGTESWTTASDGVSTWPTNGVFDDADDPLIQGLFFKSPDGRPLGSISRWAAHPVTANLSGAASHSADYPYYIRQCLSGEFGGGSVFLTGPCGNQAPLVDRKSVALARRTGEWAARRLLDALGTAGWMPLEQVGAASEWVSLPVRSDYPRSFEAAEKALAAAQQQFTSMRSAGDAGRLRSLKTLAEEIERLKYTTQKTHLSWCGLSVEELVSGSLCHPLFALRANHTVVVALPGEPFGAYSVKLRRGRTDVKTLVVEEGNGYLGYIPTADEYPRGGYGPNAAILAPEGEAALLAGAEALVDRVLENIGRSR